MIFWIGILVGGSFAWFAVKRGFYETWAFAFNIIISIYLGVFLGPVIADIVPVTSVPGYNNALCMAATAIGAFLILHGISYTFITGQFSIPFPRALELLGSGSLGFLAGFLVSSFFCLLIWITPISQQPIVKDMGFDSGFERCSLPVIRWCCNLVQTAVSRQDSRYTAQEAITELLKKAQERTGNQAEPNEPPQPKQMQQTKYDSPREMMPLLSHRRFTRYEFCARELSLSQLV